MELIKRRDRGDKKDRMVKCLPLLAEIASRTTRNASDQDAVALLEVLDLSSDFIYDTDTFMTERPPLLNSWDISFDDVQIGPADCCANKFDDSLRWQLDLRLVLVHDLDLADSVEGEGFHFRFVLVFSVQVVFVR